MYAIFVNKVGSSDYKTEQLLVETKDKEKAEKAKEWAKSNGYYITREYEPGNLGKPDFENTLTSL